MLMKYSTYQKQFLPEDRPDLRTIRTWIAEQRIYGVDYGKRSVYVDPDRKIIKPVNELHAKILEKYGQKEGKIVSRVA